MTNVWQNVNGCMCSVTIRDGAPALVDHSRCSIHRHLSSVAACTCYEAGRNPECPQHGSFAGRPVGDTTP